MTDERLTPEQVRAADPGASIWVAASAGTGKTHVLTARLLRLMLGGAAPEKLLCLTFTRAAAAEMANRLRRTLGVWSGLGDRALDAAIHAACGLRADDAARARARGLFARILDLEGGMRIETIHAFCQTLLARFPLEAGLAPHFEVIEESRAAELLAAARDRVLTRFAGDAVGRIAREVSEEGFADLMRALVGGRRQLRELARVHGAAAGIAGAVRRALGLPSSGGTARLVAEACAAAPLDALRELATGFSAHGGKKERDAAVVLRDFLAAPPERRPDLWPVFAGVFLTAEGKPRSTRSFPTRAVADAVPAAPDIVAAEIARVLAVEERLRLEEAAGLTAAALDLALAVLAAYEEEKRREGALDYDDLIERTGALLAQPGIAPWILWKLDAGIDHLLVDEAQDTNREQWRIVDALSAEFFAGAGAREALRTLFAVGDVKQSIFGFQRADPRAFVEARERAAEAAGQAGLAFDTVALERSFRSTRAVLGLVDAVFADADAARGLDLDPAPVRHVAHRDRDGGLVELWPAEEPPERPERESWEAPLAQEPTDSADARLARRIALRIRRMTAEGERLVARNRPIRPGDILVLVRRRTAFVQQLVRALKEYDVPVAGSDRMTVTDQLAVRDLLALAAFTLLPEDDLTLATVLRGPFVAMEEEALFALARPRGARSLWQALRAAPEHAPVRDFLLDCIGDAERLPPFELFSRLLDVRGGRRKLTARLGSEAVEPLDELTRLARDFERDHPPSLQAFLHHVARGGAEVRRDPDQRRDEVRIMTVHGAKGLQAPIVFLPDCCATPRDDGGLLGLATSGPGGDGPVLPVWRGAGKAREVGPLAAARAARDAERDAEYRRLLYVALTRAEDRLYVAGWRPRNPPRDSRSWYDMIVDGFARLGACEEVGEAGGRVLLRWQVPQLRAVDAEAAPAPGHGADLPDWAGRPAPAEPAPSRPLAPSRPGQDEPALAGPLAASSRDAFRRGRLLHRLLELLPDIAPDRREAAALAFLGQPAHGLDAAAAGALWREVRAVLEDAAFAPIFAPGSLAEAPLAGVVGDRVLSGRVDRLAVTPDEVLVVDYKTGRRPPAGPAGVPPAWLAQMAGYRDLLAAIFPDRPVRAALLWTEAPRLLALPDDLLDLHAIGNARLDRAGGTT